MQALDLDRLPDEWKTALSKLIKDSYKNEDPETLATKVLRLFLVVGELPP